MIKFTMIDVIWGIGLSGVLFLIFTGIRFLKRFSVLYKLPWFVLLLIIMISTTSKSLFIKGDNVKLLEDLSFQWGVFLFLAVIAIQIMVLCICPLIAGKPFKKLWCKPTEENEFYIFFDLWLLFLLMAITSISSYRYQSGLIYMIGSLCFILTIGFGNRIMYFFSAGKKQKNMFLSNFVAQIFLQSFAYIVFSAREFYAIIVFYLLLGQLLSLSIDLYLREKKKAAVGTQP